MASLAEIRAQYPQYKDLSDEALADGLYRKFYTDMPRDQFNAKVGLGAASAPPVASGPSREGDALDPVMQGLSFGFSDEIAGVVAAGLQAMGFKGRLGDMSPGEAYSAYRDLARSGAKDYRDKHPVASALLEIAGSVPSTAVTGGTGLMAKTASVPAKVAIGAAAGAATGAAAGIGAGEGGLEERVANAVMPAGIGAVAGGAAPAVGRVVAKAIGKRSATTAMIAAAPDADMLHDVSDNLYKIARQAGVSVTPASTKSILDDVVAAGKAAGADQNVTPRAWGAVQRLQKTAATGQGVGLDELDTLRKVIRGALPEGSAAANAMLVKITEKMDNLAASDVVGGTNPQQAVQVLSAARMVWSRYAKAEVIGSAIENAKNASSGFENGLRLAFKPLLRVKPNGKPAYNWTDDERKAIQAVVRGTATGNILRFLGTFGFSMDQGRNWLGVAAGAGIGAGAGGLLGGVALPAAGTAARIGAAANTKRLANTADALVRSGGQIPAAQISKNVEDIADLLLGTVARTGAVATK